VTTRKGGGLRRSETWPAREDLGEPVIEPVLAATWPAWRLRANDRYSAALSCFSEADVPGERSNAGSGCTADISRS
jgi:hypothetical protein